MPTRPVTSSTGSTLKTVLKDRSTGSLRYWNTSGTPGFEAYNAAHIANYGIATTEPAAPGEYEWTIPSTLPAGSYSTTTYRIAGASLATSDLANDVWIDEFEWDGSGIIGIAAAIAAAEGAGGANTIITGEVTQVSPVAVSGAVTMYRGDAVTLAWSIEGYTGDVADEDAIAIRFIDLSTYRDASLSTYNATLEDTATATLADGTLTLSFPLSAAQTATLTAGAHGDGSSKYACQVIATDSNETLVDVIATVKRRVGASS